MAFRTVKMRHKDHGEAIVEDDPKVIAEQKGKGYVIVPDAEPEKPPAPKG